MEVRTVGWAIAFVCIAGCAPEGQVGKPAESEQAARGPSASNVVLNLPARVLPGGHMGVTVQADLAGVGRNDVIQLTFAGDDVHWPAAHLVFESRNGDRYTFRGALNAPMRVGKHSLSWRFTNTRTGGVFGAPVAGDTEVTCSDGVFCNGEERLVRAGCVAGPVPCDDGVACTQDTCNDAARTCHHDPQGPNCADCAAKNCNPHCGRQQECGDDGCGGACVSQHTDANGNCLNGEFCVDGTCQAVSSPGTCANPLPLFGAGGTAVPAEGILATTFGDSSTGFDLVQVGCGGAGIKELVYQFDVPAQMGLEIRALSADGNPDALDTVVAVHEDDCVTQPVFAGFCSDDASPPGGLGSRVYGPLEPGSYRLIVTGYSASQVGPFQLQIKFAPACVPACDGRFCGADGCGGTCGACPDGQSCSDLGRCFTAPCTPSCGNNECGSDGCGGVCGTCAEDELCAEAEGRCVPRGTCNHLQPVCKNCGPKAYCASDCTCRKVDAGVIDLIPAPAEVLLPSVEFEWRSFDGASCALAENCVPGPGRWLLMRFTTDILNQSQAGFKPGDPASQPEFFDYHECHQHYHFSGFAQYGLYSLDGRTLQAGRKLSYCMEDTYQHLLGPNIACEPGSTCDDQGIQGGWADSYPNTLDCQWLVLRGQTPDAADIAPGWYLHETCTNTDRFFHEATFDNNCIRIPVYIPDVPDNGRVLEYSEVVPPPMP